MGYFKAGDNIQAEVIHKAFPLSAATWELVGDELCQLFQKGWRIEFQTIAPAGNIRQVLEETGHRSMSNTVEQDMTLYLRLIRYHTFSTPHPAQHTGVTSAPTPIPVLPEGRDEP